MKNEIQGLKAIANETSKTAKNPQTPKVEGVSGGQNTKFPEGVAKAGPTTGKYKP